MKCPWFHQFACSFKSGARNLRMLALFCSSIEWICMIRLTLIN